MRVDVKRVLAIMEELAIINRVPFESIDWYDSIEGTRLDVPAEDIKEWRCTGMTNTSFVDCAVIEGGVMRLDIHDVHSVAK